MVPTYRRDQSVSGPNLLKAGGLALEFEDEGGERWERKQKGMRAILSGGVFGVEAAKIADAGAAVVCGVGVENFFVKATGRNADAVIAANDGRGVEDDHEKIIVIAGAADKGDDAVVAVVAVDPFETGPFEIDFVKRGLLREEAIQIRDKSFDAAVQIVLQEMPVQTVRFRPFTALAEFLAHEKKFFAGMG